MLSFKQCRHLPTPSFAEMIIYFFLFFPFEWNAESCNGVRSKENLSLKFTQFGWNLSLLLNERNFFFFLKLSYTYFYCRIAKITDFNINWGYWHKMSNFIWICLILKCNHFCTDFWTPPLCLLCNQMFCQVLINQRGINSMTAELIWFWATELIITSPQKPCRSLLQPAPPPPSTSRLWG